MKNASREEDYPRRAAVAIAACGLVVAVAIWLIVAMGVQPSAESAPPASEGDGSAQTMSDAASEWVVAGGAAPR